jgi:hypothetical protein
MKVKFSRKVLADLAENGYRLTGEFREPKLGELYWTGTDVNKAVDSRVIKSNFIIVRGASIEFPKWVSHKANWVARDLAGNVCLFEQEPEVSGRWWVSVGGVFTCLESSGLVDVSWIPKNPKGMWELAKFTRSTKE